MSGRTMRSTAIRPTDAELLDGMLAAAAKYGCGAVTADQLADAANSTKQTLYAHFGSKENMLALLQQREYEALRQHLWAAYAAIDSADIGDDIASQVTAGIEPLYAYAAERPLGVRLLLDHTAPAAHQLSAELFRDIVAEILSKTAKFVNDPTWHSGVSASIAAMVAASAIAGNEAALSDGLEPARAIATTSAFISGGISAALAEYAER